MTYSELPTWLKQIAYERCKAGSGEYAQGVIEMAEDLRGLFPWCFTKEGYDFWRTIHETRILPTREEYEKQFGAITDKN